MIVALLYNTIWLVVFRALSTGNHWFWLSCIMFISAHIVNVTLMWQTELLNSNQWALTQCLSEVAPAI